MSDAKRGIIILILSSTTIVLSITCAVLEVIAEVVSREILTSSTIPEELETPPVAVLIAPDATLRPEADSSTPLKKRQPKAPQPQEPNPAKLIFHQ